MSIIYILKSIFLQSIHHMIINIIYYLFKSKSFLINLFTSYSLSFTPFNTFLFNINISINFYIKNTITFYSFIPYLFTLIQNNSSVILSIVNPYNDIDRNLLNLHTKIQLFIPFTKDIIKIPYLIFQPIFIFSFFNNNFIIHIKIF